MPNNTNKQDNNGRTALHKAVINKDYAAMQTLLNPKITPDLDPNIRDNIGRSGGFTPMYYAMCQNRDLLAIHALKKAGATIEPEMVAELKRQLTANSHDHAEHRKIRSIADSLK